MQTVKMEGEKEKKKKDKEVQAQLEVNFSPGPLYRTEWSHYRMLFAVLQHASPGLSRRELTAAACLRGADRHPLAF